MQLGRGSRGSQLKPFLWSCEGYTEDAFAAGLLHTRKKRNTEREMDKMKIEEVQSTAKKQRIATHTHIKGLGLEVTPSVSFLGFWVLFHSSFYLYLCTHISSLLIFFGTMPWISFSILSLWTLPLCDELLCYLTIIYFPGNILISCYNVKHSVIKRLLLYMFN